MSDNTELKAAIEYILNQGALEREFIEDADALDAAWALYEALGPAEILALIAENDAARKELGSLRTDNAQLIYALKQQEQSYLVLRGERDRLRAEVAGLRTGYEAYEQVNAELKAENETLVAAGQALRDEWRKDQADAERYRWLIRNAEEIYFQGHHLHLDPYYVGQEKIKEDADSEIDAALGQGEQS
jgi:cell division protein FtsB